MKALHALGLAAIGLFVINSINGTKNAIQGLKVYVTNPSNIRLSNGMIMLDAMVNVGNASAKQLNITSLQVDALRLSGNAWVEMASTTPDLSRLVFKPFDTTRFAVTMQSSFIDTATTVYAAIQQKGVMKVKMRITPTFLNMRMAPIYTDVFELNAGSLLNKG